MTQNTCCISLHMPLAGSESNSSELCPSSPPYDKSRPDFGLRGGSFGWTGSSVPWNIKSHCVICPVN